MTSVHSAASGSIPVAEALNVIARLEAAEVGSRELDAHVEVAVRAVEAARTGLSREHWAKWRSNCSGLVGDGFTQYAAPPASTSLDAALALAERVLPEMGPINLCIAGSAEVTIEAVDPCADYLATNIFGRTPPLALCIAILKAKAQGEGG